LLILIAGLALDALFGDMPAVFRRIPHPVVLGGRAIAFFDRKLNREARGEASRRERGIVTVIMLVGGAAVFGVFVLLYQHAWRLRDGLELDALERYDTRSAMVENLWMAAIPAASALLAALLPLRLVGAAGWAYFLYAPVMTIVGMREARGRRPLEVAAKQARALEAAADAAPRTTP